MATPPVPFLAKTNVAWTGEQDGDLGFLLHEIIKVFNIVDDHWWQGLLLRNGAEGIFPCDFVNVTSKVATPVATPTKLSPKLVPHSSSMSFANLSPSTPTGHRMSATKYLQKAQLGHVAHTAHTKKSLHPVYRTHAGYKSSPALMDGAQLPLRSLGMLPLPKKQHPPHLALQQQLYLLHVLGNMPVKAKTTENLAEPLPRQLLMQSISSKRRQLELELQRLRELEKSSLLRDSEDLLFVSEDLWSLKKDVATADDDYDDDVDHDDDGEVPPPVPKHKAFPFDSDDFRASDATNDAPDDMLNMSELKASIKSMQSDVLNLLELLATSAGSLMRHRISKEHEDFQRSSRITENPELDVMASLFKDKKSRHPKLFNKLMKRKPETVNAMEQRLQPEGSDWQQFKLDLNRMNTLTLEDKRARSKRAARAEPNFIIKPLEFVTEINQSETVGDYEPQDEDFAVDIRKVAEFADRYTTRSDFNDLIADISVKFGSSRPNEILAILLHLCKFRILEENEQVSHTKPNLIEVMAKGEATIFQLTYLFKKLLEALRIPSQVVLGFWKRPNEFYHTDQMLVNHCWLLVLVENADRSGGLFRMVDLLCFQSGSICNKKGYNDFYFLADPKLLVLTHVPTVTELQHVCPPVDLNVAFHLPRHYSGFSKNNLSFINFSNALTRTQDAEFFEADLVVPANVELFTLVKTPKVTSNDCTLCQICWVNGRRTAKIKAVLPGADSIGVLQIFAGPKGLQTHFENIHELACVISLYHTGKSKPCKFVPRYPTIQSKLHDLYIRQPQLSTISVGQLYKFEVEAHPAQSSVQLVESPLKLVIESPSGKYTKLAKDEVRGAGAIYRACIQCNEQGLFRALVIGDTGNSWYVFAQWECS